MKAAQKYEDFQHFAFRYLTDKIIGPAQPGGAQLSFSNVTIDELVLKNKQHTGEYFSKAVFTNRYLTMEDLMAAVESTTYPLPFADIASIRSERLLARSWRTSALQQVGNWGAQAAASVETGDGEGAQLPIASPHTNVMLR